MLLLSISEKVQLLCLVLVKELFVIWEQKLELQLQLSVMMLQWVVIFVLQIELMLLMPLIKLLHI
ncbi:hypothetical protein D3C87_1335010 [compost metagenome]